MTNEYEWIDNSLKDRRGRRAGLNKEELEHVALLGVTTVGWPRAIAGLSWIEAESAKTD